MSLSSKKNISMRSSDFLKYSSYLSLSVCFLGFSSSAYAMQSAEDGEHIITKITKKIGRKGSAPILSNELKNENISSPLPLREDGRLSYDSERKMYYWGANLSDIETPQGEPAPLQQDENGVLFSLPKSNKKHLQISEPSSAVNSSLLPTEASQDMILFDISKKNKKRKGITHEKIESPQTLLAVNSVSEIKIEEDFFSHNEKSTSPEKKKLKTEFSSAEQQISLEEEEEEKVLGLIDRRVKVEKPAVYPWSAHGHMKMEFLPESRYIGSGTLIGDMYVITAAHNLFDRKTGILAKKVFFFPGKDDANIPWSSKVTHLIIHPTWYNRNSSPEEAKNADIGIVKLKKPLGELAGYYGYRNCDEDQLKQDLNVTGFPGGPHSGKYMYTMGGKTIQVDTHRIFYDIDTTGGQSGSGAWFYMKDTEEEEPSPFVVAVHAYGAKKSNSGTRITLEKAEKIEKWLTTLENLKQE